MVILLAWGEYQKISEGGKDGKGCNCSGRSSDKRSRGAGNIVYCAIINRLNYSIVTLATGEVRVIGKQTLEPHELVIANGLYLLDHAPFNALGTRWCRERAIIAPISLEVHNVPELSDFDFFWKLAIWLVTVIYGIEYRLDERIFFVSAVMSIE